MNHIKVIRNILSYIWDSLTVKRYLLDGTIADPISEMSNDHVISLPLRDWCDLTGSPEDTVPEILTESEQPAV